MSNRNILADLFSDIRIPKGEILFLYVRLKTLHEISGLPYSKLVQEIIALLIKKYSPRSILIPTFTYSFTRSGVFHLQFSKSEIGRFSEEVRLANFIYRTPDPIFSVIEIGNYVSQLQEIRYCSAFGPKSLFAHLTAEDYIIVNIDLQEFVSTQLHYIERICNVPYRLEKKFNGVVYNLQGHYEEIDYYYYARDLTLTAEWDRKKIERVLVDNGNLRVNNSNPVKVLWNRSSQMVSVLCSEIQNDPEFLLKRY